METIQLWARNGDAVRQAIEWGELVHLDTASEELPDEFLLFAIRSGLLSKWAGAFPDPRQEPEIGMEVRWATQLAARVAGLYSMRKAGYVLRSAAVLGALGYSREVREPEQGVSRRGTSDDKRISGDVGRKLWVTLAHQADLSEPLGLPPCAPSQPVNGASDEVAAEARAQWVATKRSAWYHADGGPALFQEARVGRGRRIQIVDPTHVEGPRETGTSEGSGGVPNDDGTRCRGDKWATWRPLWDHAGRITPLGLGPMHVHALPSCRLWCETAPVLRKGDFLLEDRGFLDGATLTVLKPQRHVDVLVPWKAPMLSSTEAVPLAILQDAWHAHPSRAHQHIACVQGVAHVWEEWHVPRNACGMRDWHWQKDVLASSVLVTTDQQLTGPGIVRHSEARPEIAHDYEQRKSGGWQRKKLSATRYSAIVFSLATVVLSDSRYQLFANTQAGARFADKTRQALAFEQLRSRRTHVIAYAGGYFALSETLSFAHFLLQLPPAAQERLRHWLDEHLHTVQKREWPFRNGDPPDHAAHHPFSLHTEHSSMAWSVRGIRFLGKPKGA